MVIVPRGRINGVVLLTCALMLAAGVPVDRVVAVVDGDPILWSEVRRVRALGLSGTPSASTDGGERAALDTLIDRRLRTQAVAASGVVTVGREQLDAQVAAVRARFPDPAARLAEFGLDDEGLREVVRRQLELSLYVEERLGARVFVPLEDIRRHYDTTFAPQLREKGEPVPELAEVREAIRALLREQALDLEIERWTEELRRRADVIDLLDAPPREDPPLRATLP